MKQTLRKYGALALLLILIGGVCLRFGQSKSGMFIDEIYTYGLANSAKGAYLRDCAGGTLEDQILSRQDLLDYVTVQPGEGFSFRAVYDNQAADVHPPLYYWLFHIASSLTPGLFSKWTGLVLDLLLYLGALVLLWVLLKELFESPVPALAGVALYGLSLMGLTTMLMIRMYVLLTLLTVGLAWCVARLMREKKPALYMLTGLTVFAGVMTQYYFVFYAFFLCAAFVFYSLWKRDWKGTLLFAASAFAGIGLLLVCFPPCLEQLFADKLVSGGSALENLSDPSQYRERLVYFYKEVRHGMKVAVLIALAAAGALLIFGRRVFRCARAGKLPCRALLIVLPAFAALVLVALISPVLDARYVYNLCPIFTVAVAMLIAWLELSTRDIRFFGTLKLLALGGLVLFCLWFARWSVPAYQYPEHADYNAALSPYSSSPCVYLTDEHFEPLTEGLIQLLTFEEVFTTSSPESPALKDYLAAFPAEDCVLYIDVNKFWSSGFDPEAMLPGMLDLGYTDYELLYSYGLSQCYLLTNASK